MQLPRMYFLRYFIGLVNHDHIPTEAAALAFKTILGLIPALLVVVGVFAMTPGAADLQNQLQDFSADHLMPVFTDVISDTVSSLMKHAGRITSTGLITLAILTLWLLRTVDLAFNRIWGVGERRLSWRSLLLYAALLLTGPAAVALIIYISSRLVAFALMPVEGFSGMRVVGMYLLPLLVEVAVFTLMYWILPVRRPLLRDALIGALFSAVTFELTKKGFSIYVVHYANYNQLYGAMAALPVLMMWIYINWVLVLVGAEFTAMLSRARDDRDRKSVV